MGLLFLFLNMKLAIFILFSVLCQHANARGTIYEVTGKPEPLVTCPPGYFGKPPSCSCFEDNTAYFGNNAKFGFDNLQPSRLACQKSCMDHPKCEFWTWGKGTPVGQCYLKHTRDNVTPGLDRYISGSKQCPLPEVTGECQCGRKQTGNQESGDYIINGQQADNNEYPWMVYMLVARTNDMFLWGGSLISNKWILTAAHCTDGRWLSDIQIFLGLYNTKNLGNKKSRNIVEIINHPKFDWIEDPDPKIGLKKINYDFTLLKMQEPVDFFTDQHIRPICLPTNPSNQYEGCPAIATGWGRINMCPEQYPDELQEIEMEAMTNDKCKEFHKNPITSQSICAHVPGQGGRIGAGDSGGPLIVNVGGYYELVGVSSWKSNDCLVNTAMPSVFARVTTIIRWINENTKDDWTSCPRK